MIVQAAKQLTGLMLRYGPHSGDTPYVSVDFNGFIVVSGCYDVHWTSWVSWRAVNLDKNWA